MCVVGGGGCLIHTMLSCCVLGNKIKKVQEGFARTHTIDIFLFNLSCMLHMSKNMYQKHNKKWSKKNVTNFKLSFPGKLNFSLTFRLTTNGASNFHLPSSMDSQTPYSVQGRIKTVETYFATNSIILTQRGTSKEALLLVDSQSGASLLAAFLLGKSLLNCRWVRTIEFLTK